MKDRDKDIKIGTLNKAMLSGDMVTTNDIHISFIDELLAAAKEEGARGITLKKGQRVICERGCNFSDVGGFTCHIHTNPSVKENDAKNN